MIKNTKKFLKETELLPIAYQIISKRITTKTKRNNYKIKHLQKQIKKIENLLTLNKKILVKRK